MKQISLSERQTNVLMSLGRAVDDALAEFRGRTPADVATAAHSAYTSMLALQLPSPARALTDGRGDGPAPVRRKKRAKGKAKKASKVVSKSDRTVSIISVLSKSKEPLPASGIAEKLGIPGQGLGPVLNKMFTDGAISKKEVDGAFVWGAKGKHMNGKAGHAN